MEHEKRKNLEKLIRTFRLGCQLQAERAQAQLHEVAEALASGNALAALGAFEGIDEEMRYLNLVLKHMAQLRNEIDPGLGDTQPDLPIEPQTPPTAEDLVTAIRTNCYEQARRAETKLGEVVANLASDDHLAALGAFTTLDADVVELKTFLTRIARLTGPASGNP